MKREWRPGDVAISEVEGFDPEIALRVRGRRLPWVDADGSELHDPDGGTVFRPLAVIDPEDPEQVERLARSMHESDHIAPWHDLHSETRAQVEAALKAALREFANPTPRIEEPQGLGAVVEDAEGKRWIRTCEPCDDCLDKPWQSGPVRRNWLIVAPVRVLSEGVTS